MSARRPLQPLPTRLANSHRVADDDDGTQESVLSGLTSLENDGDADDDFERLMIQNARDERRLKDALRGNVQPFRKARTHPRVGLTMENLERHAAHGNGIGTGNRAVRIGSPTSSSGASDPAVRPPLEWGRKARVRKNWLRTITSDPEQEAGAQENALDQRAKIERSLRQAGGRVETVVAEVPRPSIEDSPLSRKSSIHGIPTSSRRRIAQFDRDSDLDFTLDFNEASMIASTPYIPRNTALDDIRQREMESLKENAVTASHESTSESPQEEDREPAFSVKDSRPAKQRQSQAELRPPRSPVKLYKGSETVGVVDPGLSANAESNPSRPTKSREDSHNLLKRLARASSNTPSPGRTPPEAQPKTAPKPPQESSSSKRGTDTAQAPRNDPPAPEKKSTPSAEMGPAKEPPETRSPPAPIPVPEEVNVAATPLPAGPSKLNAKTPVVTGAWVDTPGPRTVQRPADEPSHSRSQPLERQSPRKQSSQKQETAIQTEDKTKTTQPQVPIEATRPTLPGSALEAIVSEAKAKAKTTTFKSRHEDQYGDSTIDSLEELIAPDADNRENGGLDLDEDTLQGLQLPTTAPRNEAERLRQKELAHLHRMNQRLRAARTSIRDASRGMRRVEHRVEHIEEEVDARGEKIKVVYRECPCVTGGAPHSSNLGFWRSFKRLFRKPETQRAWGLTWLSIALLAFLVWFISENIACEKYCHKLYASRMVGFGVDWDAPRYPFVLPTLFWRKILKPISTPFLWMWHAFCYFFFDEERGSTMASATRTATKVLEETEVFESDFGFADDEFI